MDRDVCVTKNRRDKTQQRKERFGVYIGTPTRRLSTVPTIVFAAFLASSVVSDMKLRSVGVAWITLPLSTGLGARRSQTR